MVDVVHAILIQRVGANAIHRQHEVGPELPFNTERELQL